MALQGRQLDSLGLTMSQYRVLEMLLRRGPMGQGTLGAEALASGSNTTIVIRNLERRGLVVRRPDRERYQEKGGAPYAGREEAGGESFSDAGEIGPSANGCDRRSRARAFGSPLSKTGRRQSGEVCGIDGGGRERLGSRVLPGRFNYLMLYYRTDVGRGCLSWPSHLASNREHRNDRQMVCRRCRHLLRDWLLGCFYFHESFSCWHSGQRGGSTKVRLRRDFILAFPSRRARASVRVPSRVECNVADGFGQDVGLAEIE